MTTTIAFKLINDLPTCHSWWDYFSPNATLTDDWNFRYCFYSYFKYDLHFLVGFIGEEPIGLLPLQFNNETRQLEFFGGRFMWDNRLFIKKEFVRYAPAFFDQIQQPTHLVAISHNFYPDTFLELEYKYHTSLENLQTFEEYLTTKLNSKYRSNLRRKLKQMEAESITIFENSFEDLDFLIELNKKTFGEGSSFYKPFRSEIFHDLLKLNFETKLLTFVVNGKKEAVSLAILYNGIYTYINLGANRPAYPHLSAYVNVANLRKALELGASSFDAGLDDLGWKESFGLDKVPQYEFRHV